MDDYVGVVCGRPAAAVARRPFRSIPQTAAKKSWGALSQGEPCEKDSFEVVETMPETDKAIVHLKFL
jgi:hypothetical protein